ncbi:MAG: PGF-pre-PGF domain-containing protein [Archaeoglobaceae archaeon]
MKRISIFLISLVSLIILLAATSSASAHSMEVEGGHVNEQVEVNLSEEAFVIFRMNQGTPIYAQGSTVYFTPRTTGTLDIEAVWDEEKVERTVSIETRETGDGSGGSSGGSDSGYYLPEGSFSKSASGTGKEYEVEWRTAVGVLEKVSRAQGFNYQIEETDWGPFVDCIKGKCAEDKGTAGWMSWVNGDSIDVSANERKVVEGDSVVWYYSKGMSDTPDTSNYKVKITVKDGFYIESQIYWDSSTGNGNSGYTGSYADPPGTVSETSKTNESTYYLKNYSQSFNIQPKRSEIQFAPEIVHEFNITSLNLTTESNSVKLKLSKKVLSIPADVYDSFSVELNQSASGSIHFRVSKQWLNDRNYSKDEVALIKYKNGGYIDLPATIKNESGKYVYYQSQLDSFSEFAIIVKWENFPLSVNNKSIIEALNWLKTVQNDDGGFANPGENSSISKTSWAVMALVAAKQDPHNWTKNNNSPIDYLRENLNQSLGEMGTADYARTILALNAANEDPEEFGGVDLVSRLKSEMKSNGKIGDFVYTTIWGTLALETCDEDVNQSINWLKEKQNEDGGFPWAVGEKSDYDDTATAIQVLVAAGEPRNSEVIEQALDYLKTGQNKDGGFRYFGNSSASNAASDAWVMQALVAAGENPTEWEEGKSSVVDHLLSLQTEDGLFKYTTYQTSNPGYMTVSAVMGLLGKPQPIEPVSFKESEGVEISEVETPDGTPKESKTASKTSTPTTTLETPEATATKSQEKEEVKEETKEESLKLNSITYILAICLALAAFISVAYLWKKNKGK